MFVCVLDNCSIFGCTVRMQQCVNIVNFLCGGRGYEIHVYFGHKIAPLSIFKLHCTTHVYCIETVCWDHVVNTVSFLMCVQQTC